MTLEGFITTGRQAFKGVYSKVESPGYAYRTSFILGLGPVLSVNPL